jgi:hypothetical protein
MEGLCVYFVEIVHRMRLQFVLRADARRKFCELLVDVEQDEQLAAAVPECWNRSEEQQNEDEDYLNSSVAGIARSVSIARRLVQRGATGLAHAGEVSAGTRNVALGILAFLGWPPQEDLSANSQQYPAIPALSAHDTLPGDARFLFDALARTDPDLS